MNFLLPTLTPALTGDNPLAVAPSTQVTGPYAVHQTLEAERGPRQVWPDLMEPRPGAGRADRPGGLQVRIEMDVVSTQDLGRGRHSGFRGLESGRGDGRVGVGVTPAFRGHRAG